MLDWITSVRVVIPAESDSKRVFKTGLKYKLLIFKFGHFVTGTLTHDSEVYLSSVILSRAVVSIPPSSQFPQDHQTNQLYELIFSNVFPSRNIRDAGQLQ